MKHYYSMMVDLTDRPCLVVGGGSVAERKVGSLLQAGARVLVVSPTLTPILKASADQEEITWIQRPYQTSDGKDCILVIAATNDAEINRLVYQDAKTRGQWINVVDQPELCNFTVPSTVRRGKLQISISTSGASPMLAKKIRQELEAQYSEEYELYLNLMQEIRERLQQEVKDVRLRHYLLKELVSDEWIDHCRTHPDKVKRWMFEWIDQHISVGT